MSAPGEGTGTGRADEAHVDPELAEEFPGLTLLTVRVEGGATRSPRDLKARLFELSDRFRIAHVPAMRTAQTPSAYRAFARHIGLDPDASDLPVEHELRRRLFEGSFRSRHRLHDAMVLAMMETQVPIFAIDEAVLAGPVELRAAVGGETLGRGPGAPAVEPERLVIADPTGPVALLFGEAAEGAEPTKRTTSTLLLAVQVPDAPTGIAAQALDRTATILLSV
jgi:DNA/RNA-binding domain of Phe-tRNA-synthetase-like protein